MSVKDTDKGWDAFKAEMAQLAGSTIRVGVLGNDAKSKTPGDDATLAEIATFNEFGTSTIPARSFMRSTFDENGYYAPFTTKVLKSVVAGRTSAANALQIVGLKIQSDVQKKIVALKSPPNAPATIAKKGSSNPLIDTGRLRQSITYEVDKK